MEICKCSEAGRGREQWLRIRTGSTRYMYVLRARELMGCVPKQGKF